MSVRTLLSRLTTRILSKAPQRPGLLMEFLLSSTLQECNGNNGYSGASRATFPKEMFVPHCQPCLSGSRSGGLTYGPDEAAARLVFYLYLGMVVFGCHTKKVVICNQLLREGCSSNYDISILIIAYEISNQ